MRRDIQPREAERFALDRDRMRDVHACRRRRKHRRRHSRRAERAETELLLQRVREIVVENTRDHANVRTHRARLDRHVQIEIVVLRAQHDRARAAHPGFFENRFARAIALHDGHIERAHAGDQILARVGFDHDDVLIQLAQLHDDAKAEMSQADKNDVIVERGGDRHFPLLAARAAIEEEHAEIGETLREDADANDRHREIENLQIPGLRKTAAALQKDQRQREIDGFDRRADRFTGALREIKVQQAAADNHKREQKQGRAEIAEKQKRIAPCGAELAAQRRCFFHEVTCLIVESSRA